MKTTEEIDAELAEAQEALQRRRDEGRKPDNKVIVNAPPPKK